MITDIQAKQIAVANSIIDAAYNIANCAKRIPIRKKRIFRKKNRTPRNRIMRKQGFAMLSFEMAFAAARVATIMSAPIPDYESGGTSQAIIGRN